MRNRLVAALILVLFGAAGLPGAPLPAPPDAAQAIRTVLDTQVAAWNRGDLPGFMDGYWRSPELTFYSGTGVTSGWDATLARYQKRYQSSGTEMGKLDFSELEIHPSGDMAWVGGRWHLKMSDGKDLGGRFTLIFRKFSDGWKIVHDHTS
jgi:ketosteroid isomerase-like protein